MKRREISNLVEKYENGYLIDLPCKIGDTLFRIKKYKDPFGNNISYVEETSPIRTMYLCNKNSTIWLIRADYDYWSNQLNKLIFLTKEDALKKIDSDYHNSQEEIKCTSL